MKKPLLIITIVLVIILIFPAVSLISWAFQSKKPMNIVILDKTVPTFERLNHRSLVYVLTSERFVKRAGKTSYSSKNDYYGFQPLRPVRERQFKKRDFRLGEVMELAESSDAIYYADTYGVYFNDWYPGVNKTRRSRKLYGGLNNSDYLLFSEMKKRDKLVILEYNTFDYPTADLERYKTETLLGITTTGWTGKYYASLDTLSKDFPIWLTSAYRSQYGNPWTFKKAGLVLVKDNSVIVLEEGNQLQQALPVVSTATEYKQEFKVADSVPFCNEFEIINQGNNIVISNYNIKTTTAGDSILSTYGLTNVFPAVIQEPQTKHTYYFAGNFADNRLAFWTSRFKIFQGKSLNYSDDPKDCRRFFWLYYKPLVNGILTEYQSRAKK